MPGYIPNAGSDPLAAWMQFHPNQDPQIYHDSVAKGFVYEGGDNWSLSGGASPAPSSSYGSSNPMAAGSGTYKSMIPGAGGITSIATGGSVSGGGPYKADAQLAQVNSQFADIMKRGMGSLNEAAALSGGFSGGVPFENRQKFITDTGNQQSAAIERIMNDILGRNQSWDLDQRRFELQKQLALMGGGGGFAPGTYGSGGQNADILAMFKQLGLGGGGGGVGGGNFPAGTYGDIGALGDLFGAGGGIGGGMPDTTGLGTAGQTNPFADMLGGTGDWASGILSGFGF